MPEVFLDAVPFPVDLKHLLRFHLHREDNLEIPGIPEHGIYTLAVDGFFSNRIFSFGFNRKIFSVCPLSNRKSYLTFHVFMLRLSKNAQIPVMQWLRLIIEP